LTLFLLLPRQTQALPSPFPRLTVGSHGKPSASSESSTSLFFRPFSPIEDTLLRPPPPSFLDSPVFSAILPSSLPPLPGLILWASCSKRSVLDTPGKGVCMGFHVWTTDFGFPPCRSPLGFAFAPSPLPFFQLDDAWECRPRVSLVLFLFSFRHERWTGSYVPAQYVAYSSRDQDRVRLSFSIIQGCAPLDVTLLFSYTFFLIRRWSIRRFAPIHPWGHYFLGPQKVMLPGVFCLLADATFVRICPVLDVWRVWRVSG